MYNHKSHPYYKVPKSSSQISKTLKPYLILFFSKHGGSTIVAPLCVTRISLEGKSKFRTPPIPFFKQ